jgi:hypothetical protein
VGGLNVKAPGKGFTRAANIFSVRILIRSIEAKSRIRIKMIWIRNTAVNPVVLRGSNYDLDL